MLCIHQPNFWENFIGQKGIYVRLARYKMENSNILFIRNSVFFSPFISWPSLLEYVATSKKDKLIIHGTNTLSPLDLVVGDIFIGILSSPWFLFFLSIFIIIGSFFIVVYGSMTLPSLSLCSTWSIFFLSWGEIVFPFSGLNLVVHELETFDHAYVGTWVHNSILSYVRSSIIWSFYKVIFAIHLI